jgi:4-amino-4-deoxy-L-arabinose transferase-like glycosyltransferase
MTLKHTVLADTLWGEKSRFLWLFIAAALLLLTSLGAHTLWTQENRWASTVSEMLIRQDFLHPYVFNQQYYDKPLLSYWLILAVSYVLGGLSSWSLRFPSVFAGLLAIYSMYGLGTQLRDKRFGLLAACMLMTTYYFVFWARIASADILNMAGILFAVFWYFKTKNEGGFLAYLVFFLTLALTSLCKGLGGAVVPLIALFPELVYSRVWKTHLRPALFVAFGIGLAVYIIPFVLSSHFSSAHYHETGLQEVFSENILRYFKPFDHKGPWYTYFIFLPLYMMPWFFFFIPALLSLPKRWKTLSPNARWMVWSTLCIFIFFTASGSRRNYYILPLIPFALLMTADWIATQVKTRQRWAARCVVTFYGLLFTFFCILTPLYYSGGGAVAFARLVQEKARVKKPWSQWELVLLDSRMRVLFYLHSPNLAKIYGLSGQARDNFSPKEIDSVWPVLKNKRHNQLFISRKRYLPALRVALKGYTIIKMPPILGDRLLNKNDRDAAVAFIPRD